MAITALDYIVLRSLREQKYLVEGATMIEMGESNWYGDVGTAQMANDIRRLMEDETRRETLLRQLEAQEKRTLDEAQYDLAKIFFRGIGGCSSIASIDPGMESSQYKFDLNREVPIRETFDLVLNYGTGEHIFNVFQFYKTIHELTKPGGFMIHQAPTTGWVEHGFYNFQPTFYFDLARANGYQLMSITLAQLEPFQIIHIQHRDRVIELAQRGELPKNTMLEAVLRKPAETKPFEIPIQGYYAGALSPKGIQAWQALR